jgi:hypothetical protein
VRGDKSASINGGLNREDMSFDLASYCEGKFVQACAGNSAGQLAASYTLGHASGAKANGVHPWDRLSRSHSSAVPPLMVASTRWSSGNGPAE